MERIMEFESFINNFSLLEKMYDAIRLVDPVKKITYMLRNNSLEEEKDSCYMFW